MGSAEGPRASTRQVGNRVFPSPLGKEAVFCTWAYLAGPAPRSFSPLPAPSPRSPLLLPAPAPRSFSPLSEAKPRKLKHSLCCLKHSLYCKVIPDDHIQLFNSNSHHVEQELGKRIRPSEMDLLTCLICYGPPASCNCVDGALSTTEAWQCEGRNV
jgi:hypothetical protein